LTIYFFSKLSRLLSIYETSNLYHLPPVKLPVIGISA